MEEVYIHDSAIIGNNVQIGKNSKVWHFSHIMPNAKIGENCILGQNVFIGKGVQIGSRVKIQNNVSVFEGVELEDDVFCGPSMVFTNVKNPRSFIEKKDEFKKTFVKKGVTIGANATVICGITIGQYAFIGAGALVNKDVSAHALIVGNPSKQIGWVDKAGEILQFNDARIAIDSFTNEKYMVKDGKLILI